MASFSASFVITWLTIDSIYGINSCRKTFFFSMFQLCNMWAEKHIYWEGMEIVWKTFHIDKARLKKWLLISISISFEEGFDNYYKWQSQWIIPKDLQHQVCYSSLFCRNFSAPKIFNEFLTKVFMTSSEKSSSKEINKSSPTMRRRFKGSSEKRENESRVFSGQLTPDKIQLNL